jgi:hypothetical protein
MYLIWNSYGLSHCDSHESLTFPVNEHPSDEGTETYRGGRSHSPESWIRPCALISLLVEGEPWHQAIGDRGLKE